VGLRGWRLTVCSRSSSSSSSSSKMSYELTFGDCACQPLIGMLIGGGNVCLQGDRLSMEAFSKVNNDRSYIGMAQS
jgi:hypothetical protein